MPFTIPLLLTLLAAPGWRADVLSDDPQVRAPALQSLHAKGRTGLYAVQDLVQKSADDAERARAIRALGELGDPGAEWALRLELKQTSPQVLAAVVRAADQLNLKALARPVSDKVGNPDPGLCSALGAAAKTFPGIVETARAALISADGDQQLAGLRVLGAAGLPIDDAVAHTLIASARPEVRFAAAVALAPTDPDTAVATLAPLLSGELGDAALEALGKVGSPRALALLQPFATDPVHGRAALAALAGSDAGERLLLKQRSAMLLPSPERDAIDATLEAQPRTPDLLVSLMDDPDALLAQDAATRLAAGPAGITALVHCLESSAPQAARCAAGLASSPAADAAIGKELQSLNAQVRATVTAALGTAVRVPQLEVVAPLAADPDPDVRASSAVALGRLDAAGLPALLKLVNDPQANVRKAAATQLVRLLPEDRLHALVREASVDTAVRSAVLAVSDRLPPDDAIRLLKSDLSAPDARERREDLTQLAHYRDPEAVNALMESAAKDADPELREYALTLLANQ